MTLPFEAREDVGRWMTYWHQLREVLAVRPRRVLSVGAGSVVESYLEDAGVDVTLAATIDHLGRLPRGGFDVVCAFDILARSPRDDFDRGLAALAAASTAHVFITLPVRGSRLRWRLWWGDHAIGFGREFLWRSGGVPRDGFAWESRPGEITSALPSELDVVSRGFVTDDPRRYLWHLRRRGC